MPRRKRGNNEGSIYQMADGRWRAAITLGWKANGARNRKVLSGRTRAEVAAKLTSALNAKQTGIPLVPERQTVAQFLARWLADVAKPGTRPNTYDAYETFVRIHLSPALGKHSLSKLSPQHVQAFLKEKLSAGLEPRTVRHLRNTLRNALNVALKWQLITTNAAALVKPPRVPKARVAVYGPTEARQFLDLIRGHRLEALFVVTICLGLRKGEVLGLQWGDIDWDAGTLTVQRSLQRIDGVLQLVAPKTDSSVRTVNLPHLALTALRAHQLKQIDERDFAGRAWKDCGMVFCSTVGTMLDQRNVIRSYDALFVAQSTRRGQKALSRIRFHDLRHSAATLLLAMGVHPRIVMEILGHSSIHLTMNTYSHIIPSFRKEAADKMDTLLVPVATNVATSPSRKGRKSVASD